MFVYLVSDSFWITLCIYSVSYERTPQNNSGLFPAKFTPVAPLNDWKQLQLKPQQNVALQVNFPAIVIVVVRINQVTVPLPPCGMFHSPKGLIGQCLGSQMGQRDESKVNTLMGKSKVR